MQFSVQYTTIPIPIWKSSLLISYFPFIFFRYTWQKNGKPYDWQVYDDRILQQPGRGTLVITSPRDEDIGKSKQIIKKLVPMQIKMIRPIMTTIRKVLKLSLSQYTITYPIVWGFELLRAFCLDYPNFLNFTKFYSLKKFEICKRSALKNFNKIRHSLCKLSFAILWSIIM